jgi:hypothetical protein
MKPKILALTALVVGSFLAGFFSHGVYRKWTSAPGEDQGYPVAYVPLAPEPATPADPPLIRARDLDKLKEAAGRHARVRGTVYRVGFSAKSNTHFLNFGPSRSSFTAVIFASAIEAFAKQKLQPKSYEGRDVEVAGVIKDHPQYGLEMILEDPSQIKVLD